MCIHCLKVIYMLSWKFVDDQPQMMNSTFRSYLIEWSLIKMLSKPNKHLILKLPNNPYLRDLPNTLSASEKA